MISEFPLFVFTTLGGLAAGAYAASAVFPAGKESKRQWLFPFVCLVLLAVGLLFLPLHLGRPERMLAALTHPGAMIAQEAYWSAAFGLVALIDLIMAKIKGSSPRVLRVIGALCALGLTVVMANAYFVSIGVAAWSSWQTFLLYLCGNLAMGAALLSMFDNSLLKNGSYMLCALVLAALAAVAMVLEAIHFAGVGSDATLLIVGAVIAVGGLVVEAVAKQGKLNGKTAPVAMATCLFIAVAVARYGFYAAGVL